MFPFYALTLALSPLLGLYSPLRVAVREDLDRKLLEKVDAEYVLTQEACSSNEAFAFHSSYPSSITTQGSKQEQVSSTVSLDSGVRDCHGRMLLDLLDLLLLICSVSPCDRFGSLDSPK